MLFDSVAIFLDGMFRLSSVDRTEVYMCSTLCAVLINHVFMRVPGDNFRIVILSGSQSVRKTEERCRPPTVVA